MFIKICAFAVLSGVVYIVVSNMSPASSLGVKLCAVVLVGGAAALMIEPVILKIYELSEFGKGVSEYAGVVIRAVGVAVLAHFCADICRDCGEASTAGAVVLAAKVEILILCLPLVEKILSYASDILALS